MNLTLRNDILEDIEEDNESNSEGSSISIRSGNDVKKKKSNKREMKKEEFSVIATSSKNFISFECIITEKIKARFTDLYRFLLSSIDSLVKNFEKEKDTAFPHTQKCILMTNLR